MSSQYVDGYFESVVKQATDVFSYWPDVPMPNAECTVTVDTKRSPKAARFMLGINANHKYKLTDDWRGTQSCGNYYNEGSIVSNSHRYWEDGADSGSPIGSASTSLGNISLDSLTSIYNTAQYVYNEDISTIPSSYKIVHRVDLPLGDPWSTNSRFEISIKKVGSIISVNYAYKGMTMDYQKRTRISFYIKTIVGVYNPMVTTVPNPFITLREEKTGRIRRIELLSAKKNPGNIHMDIGGGYAELTSDISLTNGLPLMTFNKTRYIREIFVATGAMTTHSIELWGGSNGNSSSLTTPTTSVAKFGFTKSVKVYVQFDVVRNNYDMMGGTIKLMNAKDHSKQLSWYNQWGTGNNWDWGQNKTWWLSESDMNTLGGPGSELVYSLSIYANGGSTSVLIRFHAVITTT